MLRSSESVWLSGEGVCGFAKSYAGGQYCFVGLLPAAGTDATAYAASLTGGQWRALWNGRQRATVQVRMPEFTLDAEWDLKETLREMGMIDLFEAASADLSALGSYDGENLYCAYVKQKTHIELSRHGTKAAAVTWGEIKNVAADPGEVKTVVLDRPFVYAIVEQATGLPLFLGTVSTLH